MSNTRIYHATRIRMNHAQVWDENDGDKMSTFLTQHNLQGDR